MSISDQKTWVRIFFDYKACHALQPSGVSQDENLEFEVQSGAPLPAILIPEVGDTVSLTLRGPGWDHYKVLTRHFTYRQGDPGIEITVFIVVTDVDDMEIKSRLRKV